MKSTRNFAAVGSLQRLEYLKRKELSVFGNYHLIEAPQVLSDTSTEALTRWNRLLAVNKRKRMPVRNGLFRLGQKQATVILDTGLMQDNVVDITDIPYVSGLVGATHVILHDVYKDAEETIKASTEALMFYRGQQSMRNMRYMFVIQGKSFTDAIGCALNFMNSISRKVLMHIDLALPYHFEASRRGLYAALYERVFAVMPAYKGGVHLLGFTSRPDDDIQHVANENRIMGIDSSQPLLQHSTFTATWRTGEYLRAVRPEGWLNTSDEVSDDIEYDMGCHAVKDIKRLLV